MVEKKLSLTVLSFGMLFSILLSEGELDSYLALFLR